MPCLHFLLKKTISLSLPLALFIAAPAIQHEALSDTTMPTTADHDAKSPSGNITELVIRMLKDDRVRVEVFAVPNMRFVVVLSGVMPTQAEIDLAIKHVNALLKDKSLDTVSVLSKLTVDNALEENPLAKQINFLINNKAVKVEAIPSLTQENMFIVRVSGTVKNNQMADVLTVLSNLDRSSLKIAALDKRLLKHSDPDPSVKYMWSLAYLRGEAGFADSQSVTAIDPVVSTFNALFKDNDSDPPLVIRENTDLWLAGPLPKVQAARALLTTMDTPAPQVQMDMWAIQYSGSQRDVALKMMMLNQDVSETQNKVQRIQGMLLKIIHDEADEYEKDDLFVDLSRAGFDRKPTDSMSITEQLIFLGLSRNRLDHMKTLQDNLKASMLKEVSELEQERVRLQEARKHAGSIASFTLQDDPIHYRPEMEALKLLDKGHSAAVEREIYTAYIDDIGRKLDILTAECNMPLFPHLTALLNKDLLDADRRSVGRFLSSLSQYVQFVDALEIYGPSVLADPADPKHDPLTMFPQAPEGLTRESVATDRLLKHTIEAYAADMQDMYFLPLLRRVQSGYGMGSSGIGLAGKSRIVVTSRRDAQLKPELVSYVDGTRPKPFGDDIANLILPAGAGGNKSTQSTKTKSESSTDASGVTADTSGKTKESETTITKDDTALSGISKLLVGLPQGQAALIAAALLSDVEPAFTKVSPGIEIKVRPSVTPDGTSANLVLDARFGVTTEALGTKDRTDVFAQRPADAVQNHKVTTVADVSGFELFDISSFNIATSHPQAPYYLPILGRIPLFGPMFQIPRGSKKTYQESVILVNATLLPRSLGLVGFYGANFAGAKTKSKADDENVRQSTNEKETSVKFLKRLETQSPSRYR